jgi:hypothetical protein
VTEINTSDVAEVPFLTEVATPKPGPRPTIKDVPKRVRKTVSDAYDPDKFLMAAKRTVVENYNEHRNSKTLPELTIDMVHVVWFSKTLGNWKAVVASSVARGLLWEIAFNGGSNEVYLDVYKKLNNVKIPQEM